MEASIGMAEGPWVGMFRECAGLSVLKGGQCVARVGLERESKENSELSEFRVYGEPF